MTEEMNPGIIVMNSYRKKLGVLVENPEVEPIEILGGHVARMIYLGELDEDPFVMVIRKSDVCVVSTNDPEKSVSDFRESLRAEEEGVSLNDRQIELRRDVEVVFLFLSHGAEEIRQNHSSLISTLRQKNLLELLEKYIRVNGKSDNEDANEECAHECKCPCHEPGSTMRHFMACCQKCNICGKNIINHQIDRHRMECHA